MAMYLKGDIKGYSFISIFYTIRGLMFNPQEHTYRNQSDSVKVLSQSVP